LHFQRPLRDGPKAATGGSRLRADFEQTIVNKAIDGPVEWSKQAFVKAKGQHFDTLAIHDILHCMDI